MDRLPWYSGHTAGANLIFSAGQQGAPRSVGTTLEPTSGARGITLESGNYPSTLEILASNVRASINGHCTGR
jgi:hypothetical protein